MFYCVLPSDDIFVEFMKCNSLYYSPHNFVLIILSILQCTHHILIVFVCHLQPRRAGPSSQCAQKLSSTLQKPSEAHEQQFYTDNAHPMLVGVLLPVPYTATASFHSAPASVRTPPRFSTQTTPLTLFHPLMCRWPSTNTPAPAKTSSHPVHTTRHPSYKHIYFSSLSRESPFRKPNYAHTRYYAFLQTLVGVILHTRLPKHDLTPYT